MEHQHAPHNTLDCMDEGTESGFTRIGYQPASIDQETGVLNPGGVIFSPEGQCFLHLTWDNDAGEFIYLGLNFFDENKIPPLFAYLEFTGFYHGEDYCVLPESVMKQIEEVIFRRMGQGEMYSGSLVIK